jgi:hypothetical protein
MSETPTQLLDHLLDVYEYGGDVNPPTKAILDALVERDTLRAELAVAAERKRNNDSDMKAELHRLTTELADTKAMLPNSTSSVAPRGGIEVDWWSVAQVERRAKRKAEAELAEARAILGVVVGDSRWISGEPMLLQIRAFLAKEQPR